METCDLLASALQEILLDGAAAANYDVAQVNLACAAGLPGAEGLDVNSQLARLDEIAADVERIIFLKANYDQFLNNPGKFYNSQAYFCVVCMISVLKTKYGLAYSPKWKHVTPESEVPDDFGRDAREQFIHAILDGEGGTCGSLPVFIVAIGRRIGMPLKLVKAFRHLFIRWDDLDGSWLSRGGVLNPSQGEVFNIEATGPDVHRLSDAEYRYRWPRAIPDEYLKAGIYLKSLTPAEELAEFIAARAYCLVRNGRIADGVATLKWSFRLAPQNSLRKTELDQLTAWLEVRRRGPYLNRPGASIFPEEAHPFGPRWIDANDGSRVLVQIVRPDHLARMVPFATQDPANMRLGLQRRSVELPNGQSGTAEVPDQTAFHPMVAFWIELSPNEFALVHKPVTRQYPRADVRVGQPVLPEPARQSWRVAPSVPLSPVQMTAPGNRQIEGQTLPSWDEGIIKSAIVRLRDEEVAARNKPTLPSEFLPAIGFAPTHAQLPRAPGHATRLPLLQT